MPAAVCGVRAATKGSTLYRMNMQDTHKVIGDFSIYVHLNSRVGKIIY